jgi:hypothetical protein
MGLRSGPVQNRHALQIILPSISAQMWQRNAALFCRAVGIFCSGLITGRSGPSLPKPSYG